MRSLEYEIRRRTAEELRNTGKSVGALARKLGCKSGLVLYWLHEEGTISPGYLAKLHEIGCDVLYIITGQRKDGG